MSDTTKKWNPREWLKKMSEQYPGRIIDGTEEALGTTIFIGAARSPTSKPKKKTSDEGKKDP